MPTSPAEPSTRGVLQATLVRFARADRDVSKRIARSTHPLADAILPQLSNAANHSKLWVGASAVMALAGGRKGRRAAQRGMLSVLGASAITNGIFKPLVPRPRPSIPTEVRFPFVRRPTSSSFPSGHSASAAAFATATAMEAPTLAAPVAALAAGVAYSRIFTGVHYAGDVVVGSAIGVGVALATTKIWPRMDHAPAEARPAPRRVQGALSPTGEGLTIIVNSLAGPSAHDDDIAEIRGGLPDAVIVNVDDPNDLAAAIEDAAGSASALGAVGGDGTISTVARAAVAHGVALAGFPGGTLNHFARDVGLLSIADAIDAVKNGHLIEMDTASIAGRFFVNGASFGSYSELVTAREKLENKIGKWPAVVVALVSILRDGEPFEMRVDGEPMKVWMIFVGNCAYDPPGFAPATRPQLDDGLFDIRTIDGTARRAVPRLLAAIFTGTLGRSRVYQRRLVSKIEISTSQDNLVLVADGERFEGAGSFTVEKNPSRLRTYAPYR